MLGLNFLNEMDPQKVSKITKCNYYPFKAFFKKQILVLVVQLRNQLIKVIFKEFYN